MKFNIECEMEDRWSPHFVGLIKAIERNGMIGHSGKVSIFADGDGDFRPRFTFSEKIEPAIPLSETHREVLFDAG